MLLTPSLPSGSQDADGWLCVEIICNSMRPCSRHIPHNPISVFTQIFLFILPAPHPGCCRSHRRFCGVSKLWTIQGSFKSPWVKTGPRILHENWAHPEVTCCPRLALAERFKCLFWTCCCSYSSPPNWLTKKQCLLIGSANNQALLWLAEWDFWARFVASILVIRLSSPLSWHGVKGRVASGRYESVCYNNRHAAADTFQP